MASLLRTLIAGPRARHAESGLDLCYVTDNIIATSGPSGTYPQLAYRNPLSALVQHLDANHGDQWAIWEFRAEGTGYPDSAVCNRIYHYPFPDHQPPPFAYIPRVLASMRHWLDGGPVEAFNAPQVTDKPNKRVVVIHCKAGKGRTGTMSCSYLMCEQDWTMDDAIATFTAKRMRPGFGPGISIPSQLRWLSYVDRWRSPANRKRYVDAPLEITELRIWGLRDGVTCAIKGYDNGPQGRELKSFHTFSASERQPVEPSTEKQITAIEQQVVLRADEPIILLSSDARISFVKRGAGLTASMTVVTAVAHTWFNAYFEGRGPEQDGQPDAEGVFEIEWDAMDGLKGTSYRGARALTKLAVAWKARVSEGVDVDPQSRSDVEI